jgi:hypothetical protein
VSDADCAARNQLCDAFATVDRGAGPVSAAVCGTRTGGRRAIGDACDTRFTENTDCASGLCDDQERGQCIRSCDDDGDCGAGFVCTTGPIGTFNGAPLVGRFCAETCATMAGCGFAADDAESRICRRRCDVVDGNFDLVCSPRVGTLAPGAATGSPSSCRSGFSLSGTCSQPCVVDADCPATMLCGAPSSTRCGSDGVDDPDGVAAAHRICRPR